MKNDRSSQTVAYMLRHYLLFNVTDPMSEASRGYSDYTQYFSGDNTAGQINYLERKPKSGGKFLVYWNTGTEANPIWTLKTLTTHYTVNTTTGEITWVATVPTGNDNVKVEYTAVMLWVYDDHPALNGNYFPRMTVLVVNTEREDPGQGMYHNYASGVGQFMVKRVKVILRHRRNVPNEGYTYGSIKLKNYDLVQAIAKNVTDYFNTTREARPWKFYDWKVVKEERIFSEEDVYEMIRHDISVDVKIYEGTNTT